MVIDEAGMADIRTLDRVATSQLEAGGRVLLVGDHHQLPEVGAGGGFTYAADHSPAVAELTVNRRQRHPWEQAALAELRSGDVAAAVAAYLAHDRVVVTRSAEPCSPLPSTGGRPPATTACSLCCSPAPTTLSTGSTPP